MFERSIQMAGRVKVIMDGQVISE